MKWVNVPCSTALDASFICENETTPVTGSFQTVEQNILTCPPNWMLCNDTCILLIEECITVILDNKCLQEVRWLPPATHRVPCSNGSWYTGISAWRSTYVPSYIEQEQVVCEQDPGILDMVCLASQFKCRTKTCILDIYRCDGWADCEDGSDEENCQLHMCRSSNTQNNASFCRYSCLKPDCECSDLFFQCLHGGCIPATLLCNGMCDCVDSSDESFCDTPIHQQCHSLNDVVKSNSEDGECILLPAVNVKSSLTEVEKLNIHLLSKFYYQLHKGKFQGRCIKDFDQHERILFWRSVASCADHICHGMYKCKDSYCIAYRRVCDGINDCPLGQDEMYCNDLVCPGLLRCRNSSTCIHPSEICDGYQHCKDGDDERACKTLSKCPDKCTCIGLAITCRGKSLSTLPGGMLTNTFATILILSENRLTEIGCKRARSDPKPHYSRVEEPEVTHICFSKHLNNIIKLDLSLNMLTQVEQGSFSELHHLKFFNVSHNSLTEVSRWFHCYEDCLDKFHRHSLQLLDISHNKIFALQANSFLGVESVQHLILLENALYFLNGYVFSSINFITLLQTTSPRLCCVTDIVLKCTGSQTNHPLTCDTLMGIRLKIITLTSCVLIIMPVVRYHFCTIYHVFSTETPKITTH